MLLCLFKKRKKENSEDQQEVKCLGTSSVLTIQTQTPCGTSHPQFCPSYHVPCISSTSIFLCFFFFFFQYLVLVLNQSVTAQNEALIQGMEGLNKYELRKTFLANSITTELEEIIRSVILRVSSISSQKGWSKARVLDVVFLKCVERL